MKRFLSTLLMVSLLAATALLASCQSGSTTNAQPSAGPSAPVSDENSNSAELQNGGTIVLSEDGAELGSSGAVYENGILSITRPGSYTLTGASSQIGVVVTVEKTEQVELVLDNVSITNPNGPAIYCSSADKLFVTVSEGSVNTLRDGKSYADTEGPNATLYSNDDMTLRGSGSLTVIGLYKNGISSKNDIKIRDLTLSVDAYNTGIRGKDSVNVVSGNLTVKAGNDGLKSTATDKEGKGVILIEDGVLNVTAEDDALQAEVSITILAGKVTAQAGGKVTNAPVVDAAEGTLNA